MEKTLGGDRLGSGKKMKVHLHGYERSTHDLGYIWRSTMSAGTLVPFMSEVILPGDTFDINLDTDIKTHPTVGPLFGSFKAQFDVFFAPLRLYNGKLHNNAIGIGMNMKQIKLPQIRLQAKYLAADIKGIDTAQVNPSCVLAYLGLRGVGNGNLFGNNKEREFNAVPYLAYAEIYKQYYANKQEELGAVIHTSTAVNATVNYVEVETDGEVTAQLSAASTVPSNLKINSTSRIRVNFTGAVPSLDDIIVYAANESAMSLTQYVAGGTQVGATDIYFNANINPGGDAIYWEYWTYRVPTDGEMLPPKVETFDLKQIDEMRNWLMMNATENTTAYINDFTTWQGDAEFARPYSYLTEGGTNPNIVNTQEGLLIKTYQSDQYNNWLKTEWIDGDGGITELTAIDTSDGNFTIDTLTLAKKVYNMLNRIAVSGGTYDDWINAVYAHESQTRADSPVYLGGLSKELVFQEVVSNAASGEESLGTLGGRGVLAKKHKGGYIHVSVDEPGYVIGIVSLTPRIDYSQGNKWDIHLKTLDDLHKPALDEIGFQELITEQMAWWNTHWSVVDNKWITKSAGKQPAWLNYMTNVNRVYGNFAIEDNEMFMVLNRRYEAEVADGAGVLWDFKDLTTYIDPVKFNHIFADTSLDAQNFWTQISVDITARRKMSAKVMPNV